MRTLTSFRWALHGLGKAWAGEPNFRVHTAAAVLLVPIGWFLGFSHLEWIAVVLCCVLVLSSEMVNTAVERLCDRVEPGHDPLIGTVKDLMAGAVLLTSLGAALVGAIIVVRRLLG